MLPGDYRYIEIENYRIRFYRNGRLEEARPSVKLRAYYLKAINKGRQSAKNCRAYLSLTGSGYARYVQGAPYYEIHVETQLPWYFYDEHRTSITLNPEEEAYIALLGIAGRLKPPERGDLLVFPSKHGWDQVATFKSVKRDSTGTFMTPSYAIALELLTNPEFKIERAVIRITCRNMKAQSYDILPCVQRILNEIRAITS